MVPAWLTPKWKSQMGSNAVSNSTAIVFVNYNTSDQIINAIRSLESELVSKIIVVDNASPSDNADILKTTFPEVELIKLSHNVGFGEGCNIGSNWVLQNTDYPYIFFLNPDTLVEPGCLADLTHQIENKEIGAVVPRITTMGLSPALWYGGGYMNWWKGTATVPGYLGKVDSALALQERDVGFATGCALLIRREVLEKIGGFDSRYFMYEEDVELSLRLNKLGLRIRYVPSAIVRHIAQGSQELAARSIGMYDSRNPRLTFFVYYVTRNRCLTVLSHGNLLDKTRFFVGFPIWLLKKSLSWLSKGRYDAIGAVYRGFHDVRDLLNKG